MTPEEREEIERIRRNRGRYAQEKEKQGISFKDAQKVATWRFTLFGWQIEIKAIKPMA